MVKPHYSNFKIITAGFLDVQIFPDYQGMKNAYRVNPFRFKILTSCLLRSFVRQSRLLVCW